MSVLYKKVKQSHYRPGQAQKVLRKLRFPDLYRYYVFHKNIK